MELNKIYCMDCLEGMKQLKDKSIDLIVTDPPYGLNKKGIENDDSLWGYIDVNYYRILKKDSWLCIFSGIQSIPKVISYLENQGFEYFWEYIIYINNTITRGNVGFNFFQPCLIFKKGNPKLVSKLRDVFEFSTSAKERKKIKHPTIKNVYAIEKLIKCFSKENNLIADPFMGSGTTAVACKQLKRNFIGFEISKEYCDIANKRLKKIPRSLFKKW